MVLPVTEHRLTKINATNRQRLIRFAFCFSTIACFANVISSFTNNWLVTSEVLKYYVFPNSTNTYDDSTHIRPTYFKNATFGPWLFCWLDPVTEFHCNKIDFFSVDEPSDVTTSIEQSVRKGFIFMSAGFILDIFALLSIAVCCTRPNPYKSLFIAAVLHIFAGMTNFACIIVYMSAVSKEVGNKIYPASEMDDPLFHYSYGFSFVLLKIGFLCTETAALFTVIVYMSKRDERTYNRYHINTILKKVRSSTDDRDSMLSNQRYHEHGRIAALQKATRSSSIDESLKGVQKPPFMPELDLTDNDIQNIRRLFAQPYLLPVYPSQPTGEYSDKIFY